MPVQPVEVRQEEDEIMTYAQELLAESEAKGKTAGELIGRTRGEMEVVEGLLRGGVAWEIIKTATRLNEACFLNLKAHRRHLEKLLQRHERARLALSVPVGLRGLVKECPFLYMMMNLETTQDPEVLEGFRKTFERELLAKGEAKGWAAGEAIGRVKGQIEVVERLLEIGL